MTLKYYSISVWRPLFGPLHDWPLGLCDFRSINPTKDLIASDNIYPHIVAETYNVFYRPSHQWYYVDGMLPSEILCFKSYDSRTTLETAQGKARSCKSGSAY